MRQQALRASCSKWLFAGRGRAFGPEEDSGGVEQEVARRIRALTGFGDAHDTDEVALSEDAVAPGGIEFRRIDNAGILVVAGACEVILHRARTAFAGDAAVLERWLLISIECVGDGVNACRVAIQAGLFNGSREIHARGFFVTR